jgi:hypothetical protein
LDRNVKVIRTVDFGLGLACAGIAWTSGGDMSLVTPALIAGFIFAAIGIRSIPDMTKLWKMLSTVGVAVVYVGIGGFLYWHFRPQVAAPPPLPSPPVAASPAPEKKQETPPPPPAIQAPAGPKLASNVSRMVLECDSPKPAKIASIAKRRADLVKRMDLVEKMFGTPVKGDVTEDGLTFSETINSPTGPVKQDWIVKRLDDKVYVSITNQLATNNPLGIIWGLASLAPLNPDEDYAKQIRGQVEQFVKVEPGKCKFL